MPPSPFRTFISSAQTLTALKIISGALIIFGFLTVIAKRVDPDLGIHLAVGQWNTEHRSIQEIEIYTHTLEETRWINTEWVFDIWLYWMHSHNLQWIVTAIFTALSVIPFLVWIRRTKTLFDLWLVLFTASLLGQFIGVRPQMISFFFIFLLLEVLIRIELAGGVLKRKWLAASIPLFFLFWVNLHPGALAGIVLLGSFFLAYLIREWRDHKKIEGPEFRYYLSIIVLSVLATFLTPFNWHLYKEVIQVTRSSYVSKYIIEWMPLWSFPQIVTLEFIAMFIALTIRYWKRYSLNFLVSSIVFCILFVRTARMGPLFFIVALPLMIQGVRYLEEEIRESLSKKPLLPQVAFWLTSLGAGLYLLVLAAIGLAGLVQENETNLLPARAVEVVATEIREGRATHVFNDYGWGGYMMWKAPEIKLFIDGRLAHVIDKNGDSAMEDYIDVAYSSRDRDWKEVFMRRKIDIVITMNPKTFIEKEEEKFDALQSIATRIKDIGLVQTIFERFLANDATKDDLIGKLQKNGWRIIYEDDIAVVLSCWPNNCPYAETK